MRACAALIAVLLAVPLLAAANAGQSRNSDNTGVSDSSGNLIGQCPTLCGVSTLAELTNSGSVSTSSNGQTITCLDIAGNITVNHSDVTVECVYVTQALCAASGLAPGVRVDAGPVTINDSTIDGGSGNMGKGIRSLGPNVIINRAEILMFEDGIVDKGYEVYDSFIHSLYQHSCTGPGSHNDGLQLTQSLNPTIIKRNRIERLSTQTSTFIFKSTFGAISDVTIEDNYLEKTSGPNFYLENGTNGPLTNVTMCGNIIAGSTSFVANCPASGGWTWGNNEDGVGNPISNPCTSVGECPAVTTPGSRHEGVSGSGSYSLRWPTMQEGGQRPASVPFCRVATTDGRGNSTVERLRPGEPLPPFPKPGCGERVSVSVQCQDSEGRWSPEEYKPIDGPVCGPGEDRRPEMPELIRGP